LGPAKMQQPTRDTMIEHTTRTRYKRLTIRPITGGPLIKKPQESTKGKSAAKDKFAY
jgi:hypothetical protein